MTLPTLRLELLNGKGGFKIADGVRCGCMTGVGGEGRGWRYSNYISTSTKNVLGSFGVYSHNSCLQART